LKFIKLKLLLFKKVNKQKEIWKKKLKNFQKKFLIDLFCLSFFFLSFKSPASGKEIVQFLDSPDFEIFQDFRTGRNVR
jgi:hypothetical protein